MADKDTNVPNKNDFISREAAIKAAKCHYPKANEMIAGIILVPAADVVARDCYDRILAENDTMLEMLARIGKKCGDSMDDVRPVVLCRDCVYYNTTGCADGFGWCEGVMVSKGTSDDFFCAEGKQNPYECGADMRPYKDGRRGEKNSG